MRLQRYRVRLQRSKDLFVKSRKYASSSCARTRGGTCPRVSQIHRNTKRTMPIMEPKSLLKFVVTRQVRIEGEEAHMMSMVRWIHQVGDYAAVVVLQHLWRRH